MYSLTVLETRSPKSRYQQLPPEALGEGPSLPLPAVGGSWWSWLVAVQLQCLPLYSHDLRFGVSVSSVSVCHLLF